MWLSTSHRLEAAIYSIVASISVNGSTIFIEKLCKLCLQSSCQIRIAFAIQTPLAAFREDMGSDNWHCRLSRMYNNWENTKSHFIEDTRGRCQALSILNVPFDRKFKLPVVEFDSIVDKFLLTFCMQKYHKLKETDFKNKIIPYLG